MSGLPQAVYLFLDIVKFVVLAQIILSWLVQFQVLNLGQPLVYKAWSMLGRALEPFYAPIRRILPNLGGIDLSPMVLILAILLAQRSLFAFF